VRKSWDDFTGPTILIGDVIGENIKNALDEALIGQLWGNDAARWKFLNEGMRFSKLILLMAKLPIFNWINTVSMLPTPINAVFYHAVCIAIGVFADAISQLGHGIGGGVAIMAVENGNFFAGAIARVLGNGVYEGIPEMLANVTFENIRALLADFRYCDMGTTFRYCLNGEYGKLPHREIPRANLDEVVFLFSEMTAAQLAAKN
jgi:hypothetical protein